MPTKHIVVQGECLSIIAKNYGFLWKILWDHPLNAELKNLRKNPNILYPGDELMIPDMEIKEEPAATEKKHVFKVKQEKVTLNLRMMREDEPRKNIKYTLNVDGSNSIESQTDGDGWIRENIPSSAKTAMLILSPDKADKEEYELLLGHLDPVEKDSGVAKRLKNLGYFFDLNEEEDQAMEYALTGFQGKNNLSESGSVDGATLSKLKQIYGS